VTHLAVQRNVLLTPAARDFLADGSTGGGLRPLVGRIERLSWLSRDRAEALDVDTVRHLLDDPHEPVGITRIVERVARAFDVSPKEILGPSRQRLVLTARQVAMTLVRELAGLSLPQIGAAFGRDHTTVLHAVRKVADDAALRTTAARLKRELA
jgi:chromosomal replication initiator protein